MSESPGARDVGSRGSARQQRRRRAAEAGWRGGCGRGGRPSRRRAPGSPWSRSAARVSSQARRDPAVVVGAKARDVRRDGRWHGCAATTSRRRSTSAARRDAADGTAAPRRQAGTLSSCGGRGVCAAGAARTSGGQRLCPEGSTRVGCAAHGVRLTRVSPPCRASDCCAADRAPMYASCLPRRRAC